MSISDKQIAANRVNARKSHGPKIGHQPEPTPPSTVCWRPESPSSMTQRVTASYCKIWNRKQILSAR